MGPELRQAITGYSTEFLLEQYYIKKFQYTPQALSIMEAEIARRNVSPEQLALFEKSRHEEGDPSVTENTVHKEFSPIGQPFAATDIHLVSSMLTESAIEFSVQPIRDERFAGDDTAASMLFSVSVPVDSREQAQIIIEEVFEVSEGLYTIKFIDLKDRLRAFNFTEVRFSEKAMAEPIGIGFSPEETKAIVDLGSRLLRDVDQIEEKLSRLIFYYDNIENVISALKNPNVTSMRRSDLLTILEIVQVFCDEPDFPAFINESAQTLLNFFSVGRPASRGRE